MARTPAHHGIHDTISSKSAGYRCDILCPGEQNYRFCELDYPRRDHFAL